MSTLAEPLTVQEAEVLHDPDAVFVSTRGTGPLGWIRNAIALIARMAIGVALCANPLTAIVAVGWTFRLMRRRILVGWWKQSPKHSTLTFPEFAAEQGLDVTSRPTPRWFLTEDVGLVLNRPRRDGSPPGPIRKVFRLPKVLLGGLYRNVRSGITAVACTYGATLLPCLLWIVAWEYGWNNSFHKGYEQAWIGPTTGIIANVLFIAAMAYVPMAWAHLAATGDARAFFEVGFVRRLLKQRRGGLMIYAAAFALMTLPVSILRAYPAFLPQINSAWIDASAEEVQAFANRFILGAGLYVFPAYVILHLLATRAYRSAVLRLLRRDPSEADRLHPNLYRVLAPLDLLPEPSETRRHPLVVVAVATGRRGKNIVMTLTTWALWFAVVAQIFVVQFIFGQWFLGWMNQPLIHLPSLFFMPSGPA